jgi:cell division protein FtsQ
MRSLNRPATWGGRVRRRFQGLAYRCLLLGGAVAAFVSGSALAIHLGTPAGLPGQLMGSAIRLVLDATGAFGLTVDEVIVIGRHETEAHTVLAALDIRERDPILAFSPAAARARLEASPWVRQATVERSLPGTVRVHIEEREALALWQENGRFRVIDMDGVVIPVGDIGPYHHLPQLVGDDAPQHAATLLAMLAGEPDLAKRVTAAIRVSGRRWNIRFDDRVELRLPASDPAGAWHRFARLDNVQELLSHPLKAIDFRRPDRLVIEPVLTEVKKPKAERKPT